MRRHLIVLVSAIAAWALAAPLAGQATAAPDAAGGRPNRVTITDGTDDVWLWSPADKAWTQVDSWPTADTVQAEATHWGPEVGNQVVVTMDFVDLKKAEAQDFLVTIRTPKLTRVARVYVDPEIGWKGRHRLETTGGRPLGAKGLTHKVDYKSDAVLLTVSRARLSNPRWIRVAFINVMYTAEGGTFQDNPQTGSFIPYKDWKKHPPLSARLYPVKPSRPAAG